MTNYEKKICPECGEARSPSYFHKDSKRSDGRYRMCMSCVSETNSGDYRYRGSGGYVPDPEDDIKVVECEECGYCAFGKERLQLHKLKMHVPIADTIQAMFDDTKKFLTVTGVWYAK